jgi:glycosyltransferase involved in cell wall biosynthesis
MARIAIDARKIRDYGIGRYLEGLLGGIATIGGDDRFVLFVADPRRSELPGDLPRTLAPDRFRLVPCGARLYSIRELLAFRGTARKHGLDLLHFPHYVRSFDPGCPVAVTIHDAIHLTWAPTRRARLYARGMMRWSAKTAAALFTVSAAARDDLAARLGVPASRFLVTPNGVAATFAPPAAPALAAFRSARALSAPFALCLASHRAHKNLPGAIEGFRRAAIAGAELVVPARDAQGERCARALVPRGAAVRVLPEVLDDDLPVLYGAARVVLCPSLAEGFGLPALEAAACGAPVLASDLPSHREVLGDAAAFFDPAGPDALAVALAALWNDDAGRAALAAKGPPRARAFSWERTARLTLEGYRAALR